MFRKERRDDSDKPVYEIELKPEDGLYPLPYMAIQADGKPWEEECTSPGAATGRQGFFPDGSRSFEEIDRLSIGDEGTASLLSSIATIDFYRGVPPSGYTKGLPAHRRTDKGRRRYRSGGPRHAFLRLQALSPRRRAAAAGAGEGDQRHAGPGFERRLRRRDLDAGQPAGRRERLLVQPV